MHANALLLTARIFCETNFR